MVRPASAKIIKQNTNLIQTSPIYPPPPQLWVKNIKEEIPDVLNQHQTQYPENDKIASMYVKYYKTYNQ